MWPYLDQRGAASQANYNCKTSLHKKTNTKDEYNYAIDEYNYQYYYEKEEYYYYKTTNHPKEAD